MAQVTFRINGFTYMVSCDDGQEEHLGRMAEEVEKRINSIKAIGGQSGEARLLMLAALLLADEVHDLNKARPQAPADPEPASPERRARLRRLAARAEEIAADITGA
ncbi:cell division protein ZapA [Acidocella sp.]|uniref:cell division protein ZapA n=1 Tax=Acidocella sp. TaxID=50710 RepID=UPI0026198605|nr:cell division protein ZapA [Acidocella sp.]